MVNGFPSSLIQTDEATSDIADDTTDRKQPNGNDLVNGPANANFVHTPTTITPFENSTDASVTATTSQLLNDLSDGNTYAVRSSSEVLTDLDWIEQAFPYLFPFGRGGPGESRATPVSEEACYQHYLRLSSRQFQGYEFILHAYDAIARRKTTTHSYLQATKYIGQDQTQNYANISSSEAEAAAAYKSACVKAAQQGRPFPPRPQDLSSNAMSFFRAVQSSSEVSLHSQAHTDKAHLKSFAMHNTYGKPTLWSVYLLTSHLCYLCFFLRQISYYINYIFTTISYPSNLILFIFGCSQGHSESRR